MKLRTGTVYSMQFHKEIVYFNPKMDNVLDFAIVDEFNWAGFVVAPYSTPEEVPSVKSVSGPKRKEFGLVNTVQLNPHAEEREI